MIDRLRRWGLGGSVENVLGLLLVRVVGGRGGGGIRGNAGRLPGSARSSPDWNAGEMSPEAQMQDKARVNKERLKGLGENRPPPESR